MGVNSRHFELAKPLKTSVKNEDPLVEDRLLNYIWIYKDKQKKREKQIFGNYFQPSISRSCFSQRSIGMNSDLPVKQNARTKTEVWLKKEKRKLQKEIEKSVSAYKGKKPQIKSEDLKKLQVEIQKEMNSMSCCFYLC
jgi:hypothetical protein